MKYKVLMTDEAVEDVYIMNWQKILQETRTYHYSNYR